MKDLTLSKVLIIGGSSGIGANVLVDGGASIV